MKLGCKPVSTSTFGSPKIEMANAARMNGSAIVKAAPRRESSMRIACVSSITCESAKTRSIFLHLTGQKRCEERISATSKDRTEYAMARHTSSMPSRGVPVFVTI